MPDRTINWGDSETEAAYQTQDDDPTGGGNFVVAKDLNGSTVLLQYNPTAGEWEYGGPVDMGGNDLSNAGAITADALEASRAIGNATYQSESDVPSDLSEGDQVWVSSDDRLLIEDGT